MEKSMNSSSVAGARIERVNADILRVLTITLRQKIDNADLSGVSILRVETSSNLDNAKVFVNRGADVLAKVNGIFRNEIARTLNLRRVPLLRFIVDEGQKNADRVEELLGEIHKTGSK